MLDTNILIYLINILLPQLADRMMPILIGLLGDLIHTHRRVSAGRLGNSLKYQPDTGAAAAESQEGGTPSVGLSLLWLLRSPDMVC
jgi:hypothetical protein